MRTNKKQFKDLMILENSQDLHTVELCNKTLNTLEDELDCLSFDMYDLECLVTYGKTPDELRWEAEQDYYEQIRIEAEQDYYEETIYNDETKNY
jgi:hypothetical protein